MWIVLHLGQTQYLLPISAFTKERPSPVSLTVVESMIPRVLRSLLNSSFFSSTALLLVTWKTFFTKLVTSLGKLSAEQKRIAEEWKDIYNAVLAANPKDKDGKKPYGLNSEHEMLSELAKLKKEVISIPYRNNPDTVKRISDLDIKIMEECDRRIHR